MTEPDPEPHDPDPSELGHLVLLVVSFIRHHRRSPDIIADRLR